MQKYANILTSQNKVSEKRLRAYRFHKTYIMKRRIQQFLSRLSFRTGVIVLAMCIPFYIISFAQAALPTSVAVKGVLWFVFFGLAKTCQYGGLAILGVEGWNKVKQWFRSRKPNQ